MSKKLKKAMIIRIAACTLATIALCGWAEHGAGDLKIASSIATI